MDILSSKCTRQANIDMPKWNTASPSKVDEQTNLSTHAVTPCPPNGGVFTQEDVPEVSPVPTASMKQAKKPAQPSKQALALHRKWQEAAEALGGPEARIVVSKPAAKKLIFDMLHEAFAPMNITQIHQVCSSRYLHNLDAKVYLITRFSFRRSRQLFRPLFSSVVLMRWLSTQTTREKSLLIATTKTSRESPRWKV
jgi:hypothetical protein